ncbi:hypothetical protein [Arhodomonas sp. AD133]|uniref:hypothetical protein n=1 Tax=Arhodomonas sp. AD133 TaxID=3415009 RepID=UPI003EBF27D7
MSVCANAGTGCAFLGRSAVRTAFVAGALAGGTVLQSATAAEPELPPELAEVREAVAKYRDPLVAVRDGYFSTLACVRYPDGNMGVHFLNTRLLGPEPDPMKPQILLYEVADGGLQLAGVEWFVPLSTGVESTPQLFGQAFEGPMEGHEPIMPAALHHYDLHVWLFKNNPNGLFHHANPNVSCDGEWGYTVELSPTDHVETSH